MRAMEADPVLTKIERFLKRHNMAPSTFGHEAANDRSLVMEVREGRELRRKTRARVETYIAGYQSK